MIETFFGIAFIKETKVTNFNAELACLLETRCKIFAGQGACWVRSYGVIEWSIDNTAGGDMVSRNSLSSAWQCFKCCWWVMNLGNLSKFEIIVTRGFPVIDR